MNNIDSIVNDILTQLRLYTNINKKAKINVYVARQNLNPVINTLLARATTQHNVSFQDLATYTGFVKKVFGHELDIWQKPEPHPEPANHLLLTVGGLTAIIFDYEESIRE